MRHAPWTKVRETADKWAQWKVFLPLNWLERVARRVSVYTCQILNLYILTERVRGNEWHSCDNSSPQSVTEWQGVNELFGQYTNSLATISVAKWREFYALAPTQCTQSRLRLHCGEYKNNLFWLNPFAKSFNHRKGLSVCVMLQIPSDAYVKYLWCVPTWHI